jgi:hypothetical protein
MLALEQYYVAHLPWGSLRIEMITYFSASSSPIQSINIEFLWTFQFMYMYRTIQLYINAF